jgi:predicted glycoside hydrolase/deacetylase ChbG (UPF0249 family)
MRKIIINADDFGMNSEINAGISEAFERGLISSTTLIVNMPGFAQACELAKRFQLLGKIGIHLNLTEGAPLTADIRSMTRFCGPEGRFRPRRATPYLLPRERAAVENEFNAQVRACMDRGIRPTHIDSHHHIHTEWAIGAAVIAVARRNGIHAIRLTRNCGLDISLPKRIYKSAYNLRLRMYGLAKTSYFGSPSDVHRTIENSNADIEVEVHPRRNASGTIVELDGAEFQPQIETLGVADLLASY